MEIRVDHARRRMLFALDGSNQVERLKHRDLYLAVAGLAAAEAKILVSVPGPQPSSPGEPPHKQTGEGQVSIDFGWDQALAMPYVTANDYMWDLEFGTRDIAPRPWLRTSILDIEDELLSAIAEFEGR